MLLLLLLMMMMMMLLLLLLLSLLLLLLLCCCTSFLSLLVVSCNGAAALFSPPLSRCTCFFSRLPPCCCRTRLPSRPSWSTTSRATSFPLSAGTTRVRRVDAAIERPRRAPLLTSSLLLPPLPPVLPLGPCRLPFCTAGVYGPAPVCMETGKPLEFHYGVDTFNYCTWRIGKEAKVHLPPPLFPFLLPLTRSHNVIVIIVIIVIIVLLLL